MFRDIRYAVRALSKSPVIALVAIVSLALGIGGNTTIFSIVHAFLLSPLPYADADSVVLVWETDRREADSQAGVAPANYLDWRERNQSFEDLSAFEQQTVKLTGDGPPEQVEGARVSGGFFNILGVPAEYGRALTPGEDVAGADGVVVLSHELWERRLGADPNAVGKEILIDDRPHTVVGVMPDDFSFVAGDVVLWKPLVLDAEARLEREQQSLLTVGRLRDGVTIAQAKEDMAAIGVQLEAEHPEVNKNRGARATTFREVFPGEADAILVTVLMGAVGFVLLIACANIANLLMSRGEGRRTEIAVRSALGAGRGRILRQMLTESLLLSFVGGVLGTGVGYLGVEFLRSVMPVQMPKSFFPQLNAPVLVFTLAITLLAGLLFGAMPALLATRTDLASTLRDGSRGSGSRKRGLLRNALVVGQVALAAVLLAGAAVLVTTFDQLQPTDPGFRSDGVLTVDLSLPEDAGEEAWTAFYDDVLERVAGLPEVSSAMAVSYLPRSRGGGPQTNFTIDGQPVEAGEEPSAIYLPITPGYFETLEVPIQLGRAFNGADRADASQVAVVNRRFADKHFPDGDALGSRITLLGASREIVGISTDVYQRRIITREGAQPVVYLPFAQAPRRAMVLAVATGARQDERAAGLASAVRGAVWEVAPEQPIGMVQTLNEHVDEMLAGPASISQIVVSLGVLALALAAIGIYGVMAYAVSLRRREIGIRMALGARPGSISTMVTGQGLKLVLIGFVLATPATYGVLKLLDSAFFGVTATELGAAAVMTGVLLFVGLLASFLPARMAARVHPTETLRA